MPARHRKKISRQRGKGSHGWGAKKKHRGAGSRGGRGRAGLMKHKKSWVVKYAPDYFGRYGFKIPPKAKKSIRAINLKEIDAIAKNISKTEIDITELGFQKVLSTGKLTQPLTIKAQIFAKKAKEKIEKAGGHAIEK